MSYSIDKIIEDIASGRIAVDPQPTFILPVTPERYMYGHEDMILIPHE